MPQLDISTYSSQIFWLLISWGLLFLYLHKVFVPRVSKRLSSREGRLSQLLAEVASVTQQTERVTEEYEQALKSEKQKLQIKEEQALKDIQQKSDALKVELKADLHAELEAYEAEVLKEQKVLLSGLSENISETLAAVAANQIGVSVEINELKKQLQQGLDV